MNASCMRIHGVIRVSASKFFNPLLSARQEIIGERIGVSLGSETMRHPQHALLRVDTSGSTVSFLRGIGTLV